MHCLAFAVNYPAVCADCFVGGFACGCRSCEEGRLEPASILICALKVEVNWEVEASFFNNCLMCYAAVEPNVKNIALFDKFSAAALTLCACGDKLGSILDIP